MEIAITNKLSHDYVTRITKTDPVSCFSESYLFISYINQFQYSLNKIYRRNCNDNDMKHHAQHIWFRKRYRDFL